MSIWTSFISGVFGGGGFQGAHGISSPISGYSCTSADNVDTRVDAAATEALASGRVPVGSRSHTYESSASGYAVSCYGGGSTTENGDYDYSGSDHHTQEYDGPPSGAPSYDAFGAIREALADKMNQFLPWSGDAAKAIAEHPATHAAVSAAGEAAADALQTIGDELIQDQP